MNKSIKPYYFQEFRRYEKKEIDIIFKDEERDRNISELFENNILKLESSNLKTYYYFNYVGIICFNESICVVLPKYLEEKQVIAEKNSSERPITKKIIEVFKTYTKGNRDETYFSTVGDSEENNVVNKFAIYDFLIQDYIEYGLYESQKNIYELNGEGEIDWEKTVNECESYLTRKKSPFYFDYYTHEIESDNENYIKMLHKHYLNVSSEYFERISFLGLDYPVLNFQVEEDLGNLEFQIFKLYKELQGEFSERKIRLLKNLIILLESETHETDKTFSFYGTTSFYNVWEKACGEVLGNQYEEYKNHISKPKWTDKLGRSFEKDTLIPDILVLRDNTFYIFDAKYYNTDISDRKGLQGIESITKQYLYELAFREHPKLKGKRRKNIFLTPSNENEIEYNGKVEIDFLKNIGDISLHDIQLYKLPANLIFEKYVNKIQFTENEYNILE